MPSLMQSCSPDVRSIEDGIFEMRIQYGPGYRLYFIRRRL